jgi:hypothetical protein
MGYAIFNADSRAKLVPALAGSSAVALGCPPTVTVFVSIITVVVKLGFADC